MSNRVSAQKAAALAAAYGLAERNLSEYKEKVAEKLTGPKKAAIDEEMAQDRVNKSDGYQNIVMIEGEVLCFDEPTGRYFNSTMENIKSGRQLHQRGDPQRSRISPMRHPSTKRLGLPGTYMDRRDGLEPRSLVELKYSRYCPQTAAVHRHRLQVLPKADYIPKHY